MRDATDRDLAAVQQIYSFYVLNRLATFEEQPPTEGDLAERRRRILDAHLPFLVATIDDRVAGYAYASPYRSRPAYRFSVEDSVYVRQELHSKGIGTALLSILIERCEAAHRRQMIAIIGGSANSASIALHRRFNFEQVGILKGVGYKLGCWVDTVLMQRSLGPGAQLPPHGM